MEIALDWVRDFLTKKNLAYGDSALSPKRIFYRGDATARDLIRIRLDDKMSRLIDGDRDLVPEKEMEDMLGYFLLDKIAEFREKEKKDEVSNENPRSDDSV